MNTYLRRRLALLSFKLWDCFLAAAALSFAAMVQSGALKWQTALVPWTDTTLLYTIGFLVFWHWLMERHRLYESRRTADNRNEHQDVLYATAVGTAALALGVLLAELPFANARFMLTFGATVTATMLLSRLVMRLTLRVARTRGRNLRFALIVGMGPRGREIAATLEAHPDIGYRVVGFVDDGEVLGAQPGTKPLGSCDDIARLLSKTVIDEVFIALPIRSGYERIQRVVNQCEEQGVPATLMTDFFAVRLAQTRFGRLGAIPSMRLYAGPDLRPSFILKRFLDLAGAGVLTFFLTPVFLGVALAIKLKDPGPIFFTQTRVGFNKRPFTLYKFRTMVVDAESRQAALESQNEAQGPVFKIRNDPRITRLGAFLRRSSLDELPQLFNVLRGDMSLVGPRPLPVRDVEGFQDDWQRRRFSVRPGITCLWQLSGRSDITFERWMELDLEYIDNWSLRLDLKILLRTVSVVLKREGAY
jgi:exopolysaccharide biosynthesis polyprenyl glycosylphosphotransferase